MSSFKESSSALAGPVASPSQDLAVVATSLAQPAQGSSPTTFHHFKKLPLEIRQMIWKAALPERMLTFSHRRKIKRNGTIKKKLIVHQPHRHQLRSILLSCMEAHDYLKRIYFTIRLTYLSKPIFFSPTHDTLLFGPVRDGFTISIIRILKNIKNFRLPAYDKRTITIPRIAIAENILREQNGPALAAHLSSCSSVFFVFRTTGKKTGKLLDLVPGESQSEISRRLKHKQHRRFGPYAGERVMEQGDRAARMSALMMEMGKKREEMPVCQAVVLSRKEWRLRGVAFGV